MTAQRKAFATGTTVAPEKSRAEIETVLKRYGATGFAYATEDNQDGSQRARIEFLASSRRIRFGVALPAASKFTRPERGANWRNVPAPDKHEAEVRRLWRALLLGIKAKLELASTGSISTFEAEFMAHIVMPDGLTVAEHALPKIAEAYSSGRTLALLPGPAR